MTEQNGVNISLREIYDIVQDVRNEVKGIGPRMHQLEKDVDKGVQAFEMSKDALEIAKELQENRKWLWRTIGAAFITGIVAAIIGFMVLALQLGIMNSVDGKQAPAVKIEENNN